jgi:putative salt-induced outer membrane protein YdiY
MMKKHSATLLICALGFSTSAEAIVNMEDLHTGSPKVGLSGKVELAVSSTTGNTEKEDYTLGTRLQWHKDKVTDYLLLRGAYGESAGIKTTENSFLHARHIYQFRPRLAAEAYVQAEQDTFARLELRSLAGAGGRFTLYEQESQGVIHLGLGAYYSKERIDDSYADGGTEKLWRGSTYLILKYQASENTALVSSTYYQPAFEGADDYRMLEQAAMKVKLNDTLSLVLSADYRYDSKPPIQVEKRDVRYTTSFSLEF